MATTTEKEITVADGLGTADASQVLAGKTFSSESGFNQTGTLVPELPIAENIEYDNTDSGMTAENVQDAVDEVKDSLDTHTSDKENPHDVTKSQVGLGNVDNTSDADKPISTAQQTALDGKADLDSTGKVPSSQLPSYVDDVLEYDGKSKFPTTGETEKIYVDTSTNLTYRWSGTTYVEISPSIALGETSSTAYRGDRGKTAYDHSQKTSGNPHGVTKSDVGLGNVENKSSETIRSEITSSNVTNALGYTPTKQSDIDNAIDNIEIGGRNLLVGTKDFNITNAVNVTNQSTILSGKYDGFTVRYKNTAWNFYRPTISLKAGTYTFSAYVKGNCNKAQLGFSIEGVGSDVYKFEISSDWERKSLLFAIAEDSEVTLYCESCYDGDFYACGWKLENGNKATPWTPAIEDTEAEIQAVDKKLTTNLLKPTLATTTQNGVTCTQNVGLDGKPDGTYTVNGTAVNNNAVFRIPFNPNYETTYKIVGCPSGGGSGKYGLELTEAVKLGVNDWGEGATITPIDYGNPYYVMIVVYKGYTVNNLVFKPMITTNLNANVTYDDFVPYTGSTGQLNSDVAEVRKDVDVLQTTIDGKISDNPLNIYEGIGGNNEYLCFAEIEVLKDFANRPIEFELISRDAVTPCYVSVLFGNAYDNDPDVFSLQYFGTNIGNIFIHKVETSKWKLYVHKVWYNDITVAKVQWVKNDVKITYPCVSISEKPTENVVDAVLGYTIGLAENANYSEVAKRDANNSIIHETYALLSHSHAIADVTGLQTELDSKADLDSTGKVSASQLPSYVDMLALKGGSCLGSKKSVGDPDGGYIAEIEFASGRFGDLNVSATIYNGSHVVYPEEKGTWTGTLKANDGTTVATSTGLYRKIGDMVYVQIYFVNTSNTKLLSSLSGLPCPIGRIGGPHNGTTLVYQASTSDPIKPVNLGSEKSTTVLISGTTSGIIYVYGWYQAV